MEQEQNIQLPLLRSAYSNFTQSERRIADYIDAHAKEIMEQTISELASHTQSSEITISRFCKKLGFSGLQGLKISLASDIFSSDESIYQDIRMDDSCEVVAGKLFQNITDGLQDTLKLLNFDDVHKAVLLLRAAKRIAAYGFGNSATVCRDIETRFLRFGIPVQAYSDSHLQVTSASLLTPEDVVIAVSHTGATLELLQSVEIAGKNGARIVAITSYANSPLSKLADITLNGMGREVHYRSEAVASRVIHIAIMDLIYTEMAMLGHDTYMVNIQKMRQAIAKKRV